MKLVRDSSNNCLYSSRNLFHNFHSCSKYKSMSSIQWCNQIFRIQDHFFKSFHIRVSCHTCQFFFTISIEDSFQNLFEKKLFLYVSYFKESDKSLFGEFICSHLCKRFESCFSLTTKMKISHQLSQLF